MSNQTRKRASRPHTQVRSKSRMAQTTSGDRPIPYKLPRLNNRSKSTLSWTEFIEYMSVSVMRRYKDKVPPLGPRASNSIISDLLSELRQHDESKFRLYKQKVQFLAALEFIVAKARKIHAKMKVREQELAGKRSHPHIPKAPKDWIEIRNRMTGNVRYFRNTTDPDEVPMIAVALTKFWDKSQRGEHFPGIILTQKSVLSTFVRMNWPEKEYNNAAGPRLLFKDNAKNIFEDLTVLDCKHPYKCTADNLANAIPDFCSRGQAVDTYLARLHGTTEKQIRKICTRAAKQLLGSQPPGS